MQKSLLLVALSLLLAPAAYAQESSETDFIDMIHLSLEARALYGPVDGFFRIPRAGALGSSAPRRPQLRELGFERALVPDLDIGLSVGPFALHLGMRMMRFNGSTLLEEGFVSRDTTFPSGARIRSRISLDYQRLNLRYRLGWDLGDGRRLDLTPRFGLVIMRFDWEISSGTLEEERAFTPVNLEAGLEVRFQLNPALSFLLDVSASPPLTHHNGRPGISTASLGMEWRVLDAEAIGGVLHVGLGIERVDFKDAQPLPNRIDITFGPYVELGLRLEF